MKLVWTRFATDNLQAIYDHIAQTSSDYARSMIQRITSRANQIETFPFSGRVVPEFQVEHIREVFAHPYRIIYRVRANRIDVITVIHMARQFKADEPSTN